MRVQSFENECRLAVLLTFLDGRDSTDQSARKSWQLPSSVK